MRVRKQVLGMRHLSEMSRLYAVFPVAGVMNLKLLITFSTKRHE
jgi:hypothetical protein